MQVMVNNGSKTITIWWTHPALVLDVHHGVQHISEVHKSIFNQFLCKNLKEMLYQMAKRKVHKLLDILLLVLILNVHHGVQHVPEVLKSVFNLSIFFWNMQKCCSTWPKKNVHWCTSPGTCSWCPPWCPTCPWGTWTSIKKIRQKWCISRPKRFIHFLMDSSLSMSTMMSMKESTQFWNQSTEVPPPHFIIDFHLCFQYKL